MNHGVNGMSNRIMWNSQFFRIWSMSQLQKSSFLQKNHMMCKYMNIQKKIRKIKFILNNHIIQPSRARLNLSLTFFNNIKSSHFCFLVFRHDDMFSGSFFIRSSNFQKRFGLILATKL